MGIAQWQGEGRFDSSGAFTLDPRRERQKLGRYALAGPHDYLLKLVQAANLMKADEVQFYLDKSEILVTYFGGLDVGAGSLCAILNGERPLPSRGPLRALGLALQDVLLRSAMALVWTGPDATVNCLPGQEARLSAAGGQTDWTYRLLLLRTRQAANQTLAREREELRGRCAFSSSRVLVNRQVLRPTYPCETGPADRFLTKGFVLGEIRSRALAARLPRGLSFVTLEGADEPASWVVLPYQRGRDRQAWLLRDGVLESRPHLIGVHAVVDVSDLPADLSGLQTVADDHLRQRLEELGQRQRHLRDVVRQRLGRLTANVAPDGLIWESGLVFMALLLLALLLLAVPPLLGFCPSALGFVVLATLTTCAVHQLVEPRKQQCWERHNAQLRFRLAAELDHYGD